MNNVNFNLYRKNVKVILNNDKEITGIFTDDFEDDNEIMVNGILIKYSSIKEMVEIKE